MKKNRYHVLAALLLVFSTLLLTACAAEAAGGVSAPAAFAICMVYGRNMPGFL